jgi:predicted phage terminase large subunit-like protein
MSVIDDIPKVINPNIKYRLTPLQQLQVAKHISPDTFENKTPAFHIDLLTFINGTEKYKACAVFRGAGKTTLLNKINIFCRVFFECEPMILICSASREKAENFLANIQNMVIEAKRKGYSITEGSTWKRDKIEVIVNKNKRDESGNSLERTCTIVSISVGVDPRGYLIGSARPTLIICDDMESNQGQFAASSSSNRKKVERFFYSDLLPSLHPARGQIIIIGTILHIDSLLNNIVYEKEDNVIQVEGENETQEFDTHKEEWDIKIYPIMKDGKPTWNSRFPLKHIYSLKNMLSKRGLENEFYQEFMCKPFSPDKQFFKKEQFNYYQKLVYKDAPIPSITMRDALSTQNISCPTPTHILLDNGQMVELRTCEIYTTMDLASYDGADKTAIITFALAPDNNIYILDISCGHWTPFEKSVNAIRVQTIFNPYSFGVEKASAQNDFFYTIQAAQKETGIKINVTPLSHHSRAKNVRIAQLHPLFITGRIHFNRKQAATLELEAELLGFDPEVESKHDDLMDALAYMVEFIGSRDMLEEFGDIQYVDYDDNDNDDFF